MWWYEILSLDLTNIFDSFLPQLLSYPNPTDPLNGEAASLFMSKHTDYIEKVKGKDDSNESSFDFILFW